MVTTENVKNVHSPSSYNNGMNQMSCGTAAEIFGTLDSLMALYKKLMKLNNDLTQNQLNLQSSAIANAAEYGRQAAASQASAVRARAGQAFVGAGTTVFGAGGTAAITRGTGGLTRNTVGELGKAHEQLGKLDALHLKAQNLPETPRNVVVGGNRPPPPPLPELRQARMEELKRGKWDTTHNDATTEAAFKKLKIDGHHEGVLVRLQKTIESKHTEIGAITTAQSNTTQMVNMVKDVVNQSGTGTLGATLEASSTTAAGEHDADKNVAQAAQGINSAAAEATKQAEAKAYEEATAAINALKQAVDKVQA